MTTTLHRRSLSLAAAAALGAGLLTGTVGTGISIADTASEAPSTPSISTPSISTPVSGTVPAEPPANASPATTTPEATAPSTTTPRTTTPPASTPVSTTVPAPSTTTHTPAQQTAVLNVVAFVTLEDDIDPVNGVGVELRSSDGRTYAAHSGSQVTLPVGDYTYTTTSVPTGFTLIHGEGSFQLGRYGGHIQINLGYAHPGGSHPQSGFSITKRDRVTGRTLAGAEFRITTCGGRAITTVTTDKSGEAGGVVFPGCYRATETIAPAGYLVEAASYTFHVTNGKVDARGRLRHPGRSRLLSRSVAPRSPLADPVGTGGPAMRTTPRTWLAAAVLAASLVSGCAATEHAAQQPSAPSLAQSDLRSPLTATTADRSAPVVVTAGGGTARVDAVATDTTGTLLPPQDVSRLGWWIDSALPGSGRGTIVVAGHVDDVGQGTGFAARFSTITSGSTVRLTLKSGNHIDYRITRIQHADKKSGFPATELNRTDGAETLALVTCGGQFVGPPLGYRDNVIAWAERT